MLEQTKQEIQRFVTIWAVETHDVSPRYRHLIRVTIDDAVQEGSHSYYVTLQIPGVNQLAHLKVYSDGRETHIESVKYEKKPRAKKRSLPDPAVGKLREVYADAAQAHAWSLKVRDRIVEIMKYVPESDKELHQLLMLACEQAEQTLSATLGTKETVKLLIVHI
jgi:hypothetical protein